MIVYKSTVDRMNFNYYVLVIYCILIIFRFMYALVSEVDSKTSLTYQTDSVYMNYCC